MESKLVLNAMLFFFILNVASAQFLMDKTVTAKHGINNTCLEVLKGKNMTLMQRCEFFKCFEDRFPCGNKYWIMNWGYKYCRRYADPEFTSKFTDRGKKLLDHVNKCLPRQLEKFYKTKKSINCKRLYTQAFDAQHKCYAEKQKDFCVAFPDNKELFIKVLDQSDFLNFDSISMIRKSVEKCEPKINLSDLLNSSGVTTPPEAE